MTFQPSKTQTRLNRRQNCKYLPPQKPLITHEVMNHHEHDMRLSRLKDEAVLGTPSRVIRVQHGWD